MRILWKFQNAKNILSVPLQFDHNNYYLSKIYHFNFIKYIWRWWNYSKILPYFTASKSKIRMYGQYCPFSLLHCCHCLVKTRNHLLYIQTAKGKVQSKLILSFLHDNLTNTKYNIVQISRRVSGIKLTFISDKFQRQLSINSFFLKYGAIF